ncbi:MAG TPA: trans-aconitate 2-methyltransferase [Bauldia sp.]|nr:trans-aconitate 2-methyltransferase [Bauldia sp.]
MPRWSPAQYLKFEDERTRPAIELLSRVPIEQPKRVLDLGCGPGNSTELLAARYPQAEVVGLDSSPEMIAEARKRLPSAEFIVGDIRGFAPKAPYDLIFANAVFQWVPDHLDEVARLLATCPRGGAIAIQMPDNLNEPTHMLMAAVARSGSWRERFARPIPRDPVPAPSAYYDRLKPLAASVDVWHTTYYHVLPDAAAIVEWVKGTGLRPWLDRLDDSDRRAYLAAYSERIAETYPPLFDGRVMLRFPRLFVVAVRS